MRKRLLSLVMVLLLASLAGCATKTQEEIDALDYGPYPTQYEQIVKDYMDDVLFDPYSAHYVFHGEPTHQYRSGRLLEDDAYGWGGTVSINAKNRYGGYVGSKLHDYIIHYGKLVWLDQGPVY